MRRPCCKALEFAIAEEGFPFYVADDFPEIHVSLTGSKAPGFANMRFCLFCGRRVSELFDEVPETHSPKDPPGE